eukprot:CAMPEP_0171096936 /NCGR_PEP_ID=MMETSP0766_2-20121228/46380_1 /TAXON_ID=439317 /ORGANISM="Gambierdiscus australes, Strain CAWD 149" /LENGTH=191 /DNA_ID=CAMNT_0011556027 /DNA_START=225 /DNA_END=800 /DNA_ORIENTATION=+
MSVALAAFCLAGLPIIVLAAWAVEAKVEPFLRVYMLYLVITLLVELAFAVKVLIVSGPCVDVPELLKIEGQAWACGIFRGGSAGVLAADFGLSIYVIFLVWSYCEDMANGGGPDLADLVVDDETREERRILHNLRQGVKEAAHDLARGRTGYGSLFSMADEGGMGGSVPVFGGRKHEMRYPPPSHRVKGFA